MAGQLLPWIDSGDAEGNRNSMQNFLSDGVTTSYDFNFAGGYIDVSHVKAYIYHTESGITEAIDPVVLTGPNTIQVIPAVPLGDYLVVYRDTPKDQPLVDYTTGSVLDEANLDKANQQAVFATAEMADRFDAINASSADAIERSFLALTTAQAADAKSDTAIADSAAAVITADAAEVTAANALAVAEDAVAAATGFEVNLEVFTPNDTTPRGVDFQLGTVASPGNQRWFVGMDNASDLTVDRYNDAGALQGSALKVDRQTGSVAAEADVSVGGQLDMTSGKVVNLANGVAAGDAVNKGQLDAGDAAVVASSLQRASNLSDLTNTLSARQNLGLGGAPVMGRNLLINADFQQYTRGSNWTFSAGQTYVADRWRCAANGSSVTTAPIGFTVGQTDVPGNPHVFQRATVTSVAGAANYVVLAQTMESVKVLSGRSIAVSFWAKADAAKQIAVEVAQNFGGGGSPSAEVTNIGTTKITLSTTWTRYRLKVNLPSITGKTLGTQHLGGTTLHFWLDAGSDSNGRTNSLGQQSIVFDLARPQVEIIDAAADINSAVTDFEEVDFTLNAVRCLRYCRRFRFFLNGGPAANYVGGSFPHAVNMLNANGTLTYNDDVGNVNRVTTNSGGNNVSITGGGITGDSLGVVMDFLVGSLGNWCAGFVLFSTEII
ncbi:tail fiber protein [Ralstonia phage vB_RsoP_BMB50]|uniref:Tail fiber protein n=1 Tax=Ralstonia phage vB_RsoP_BMB50 TaxID=2834269 RepID=A0A8E5KHK2_9CAUD|nr:tail fiber protein [Ralstonia phage vB_RsoP_BMB50]